MKNPQGRRFSAIACAMGLGFASANIQAAPQYKFGGFGTLAATKASNDKAGFRTNVDQHEGAGEKWDFGVDSKFALQGSAIFENGLTATAQILGGRRKGESFETGFEWAYLQYAGIDGLDLKAGRVVLPSFLVSDTRLVGYSTPWLRVSPLVYGMMPISSADGAQATYRHALGNAMLSAQITYGNAKAKSLNTNRRGSAYVPYYSDLDARDIKGINLNWDWNDWTVHFSQVGFSASSATTAGSATPNQAPLVLSTVRFRDKFQEAGIQFDNGRVVFQAEYVKRTTEEKKFRDENAWYVATGYRFDRLMPYVMLSEYRQTYVSSGPLPPKSKGLAIGGRFELTPISAIKAEWAQYKSSSSYIFTDVKSPEAANKNIDVLSVALEFVF